MRGSPACVRSCRTIFTILHPKYSTCRHWTFAEWTYLFFFIIISYSSSEEEEEKIFEHVVLQSPVSAIRLLLVFVNHNAIYRTSYSYRQVLVLSDRYGR